MNQSREDRAARIHRASIQISRSMAEHAQDKFTELEITGNDRAVVLVSSSVMAFLSFSEQTPEFRATAKQYFLHMASKVFDALEEQLQEDGASR